jgi:hypothetical protein
MTCKSMAWARCLGMGQGEGGEEGGVGPGAGRLKMPSSFPRILERFVPVVQAAGTAA